AEGAVVGEAAQPRQVGELRRGAKDRAHAPRARVAMREEPARLRDRPEPGDDGDEALVLLLDGRDAAELGGPRRRGPGAQERFDGDRTAVDAAADARRLGLVDEGRRARGVVHRRIISRPWDVSGTSPPDRGSS